MISRLSAWEGFVLSFLGRGPPQILRWTCPCRYGPTGHRGAGLGVVTLFSTWWRCLAHWVYHCKCPCSFPSSPELEVCIYHSSRCPHRHEDNNPLCVLSFCQIPALTLYPSCLPAKCCSPPVFYLRIGCVSKPHISEAPVAWTYADLLVERLPVLRHCRLVPEHICVTMKWFRLYSKSQHIASTRVCCPQPVSLFHSYGEWGSSMALAGSFASGTAVSPLPNTLHAGNHFSPSDPRDPQTLLHAPGIPPCFPTWEPLNLPGLTLVMSQTSKTSNSALCCL